MVAPYEIYGRGPCLYALPDIKTLNKVIELNLKNASLSIGGVFTAVDDGVLNPQGYSDSARVQSLVSLPMVGLEAFPGTAP